jgi:hypothetical protein
MTDDVREQNARQSAIDFHFLDTQELQSNIYCLTNEDKKFIYTNLFWSFP